jgi:hypothetical protein
MPEVGNSRRVHIQEHAADFKSSSRTMRFPTNPATHSNRKPAIDSDLKPAGVPI